MKTLSERLSFSTDENDHDPSDNSTGDAIIIDRRVAVDYPATLYKYCEDNNISTANLEDGDFESAVYILETYGEADKSLYSFYFWIDKE